MTQAFDITAILNAHNEGVLAGPTLFSFERAIEAARASGLSVEGLIVLDRPNAETQLQFAEAGSRHRVLVTDHGDPGAARNAAVNAANGRFVGFLDGDDLWCDNWLAEAHALCLEDPEFTVAHSEINIVFGKARAVWFHVDSKDPSFDPDFLRYNNYWDAMALAARSIYLRHPFVANDLRRGFGHEDWHWNCATLSVGIHHRPAAGTVHFKRRRGGSVSVHANAAASLPWVTPVAAYDWKMPVRTDRQPHRSTSKPSADNATSSR